MTVVDERLYPGDGSLYGSLIVRSPAGITYRARVRRDAYDNQCNAVVETWMSDRGWREVQHVPIADLPVFVCSYVHATKPERWHREMRESLLALYRLGVAVVEAGLPGHGRGK